MKNKKLAGLCLLMSSILACTESPKEWPDIIRAEFATKDNSPKLILIIPEASINAGKVPPMIVVPAGDNGFDNFTPIAFLPGDDDRENQDPGPETPNGNTKDTTNEPAGGTGNNNEGNDPDDTTGNNNPPPVPDPYEGWPPAPDPFEGWPPATQPPTGESEESEEEIDRKLKEALERAYADQQPQPPSDPAPPQPDSDRIRLRLYTPIHPYPMPDWFNPDTDITPDDPPELPDFHLPRWEDLPEDPNVPPFWAPRDEPWPPRIYRFPDSWKPLEDGYRYGGWRIYVIPFMPE